MDSQQLPPRDAQADRPIPRDPVPARDSQRSGQAGRVLAALILIALGIIFLAGNLISIGGLLFLGLGAAFLLARLITGTYGFAIPAGILLGFGSYVALDEANLLPSTDGGWFFVLLGLGFLAVYVIGLRPTAIWPFFPAAALIAFGLLVQGLLDLGPLAQYAWLGAYWPLVLIAFGLWLLVRDRLPETVRQPVAMLGALVLLVYAVVAGAGALASVGVTMNIGNIDGVRVNGMPFGTAPLTETIELSAPIGPGQTLTVNNTAGATLIRPGDADEVQVTVTKHRWSEGQRLDVELVPTGNGVSVVQRTAGGTLGRQPYADYVIEVPSTITVQASSASGRIGVSGLEGPVDAESMSGSVRISDIGGPVRARSTSGSVRVEDVSGPLRASSVSGSVQATNIADVRDVSSTSGSVRLDGIFRQDARVHSVSGSVNISFDPESSVRIDASTLSGSISVNDLDLRNRQQSDRRLSGVLGTGAGHLVIETTSGSIRLSD